MDKDEFIIWVNASRDNTTSMDNELEKLIWIADNVRHPANLNPHFKESGPTEVQ